MFSLDEDDEGEISVGESSDAERKMTPDIPEAPSVKTFDDAGDFEGASDVDSGTLRAFVVAVIYANAAVLLVALGPMVWFFEGWSRLGPALIVAGLLAGVRTYQTYRSWSRARDGDADSGESGSGEKADVDSDADPDDETATADDDRTGADPEPASPEA
ncbi:hypothetical protein [Halorubrum sp. AJ67]|uniref:DUF7322 domain-containing protein n=1 Tax=Halorubrum sp. AJ67 TaxID=1173487 RepID=UPI0003DC101E|nr:hypothetical protein [Halorubrum sp. AJ67]CDK39594.1 uncharacterized protein BN903_146 [Halorubrum sp. AJ67]